MGETGALLRSVQERVAALRDMPSGDRWATLTGGLADDLAQTVDLSEDGEVCPDTARSLAIRALRAVSSTAGRTVPRDRPAPVILAELVTVLARGPIEGRPAVGPRMQVRVTDATAEMLATLAAARGRAVSEVAGEILESAVHSPEVAREVHGHGDHSVTPAMAWGRLVATWRAIAEIAGDRAVDEHLALERAAAIGTASRDRHSAAAQRWVSRFRSGPRWARRIQELQARAEELSAQVRPIHPMQVGEQADYWIGYHHERGSQ